MKIALATTLDTPDGRFSVVACDDAVLASGWTVDIDTLASLIHTSLRPEEIVIWSPGASSSAADDGEASRVVVAAVRAVEAYYGGDYGAPTTVAVRQHSGAFRQQAWQVLRAVSPGAPISYAQFAAKAGRPRAIRAAAGACAYNAAALFVPCHRITRSDGSLGGFRYGLPVKAALLAREATSV